MTDYPGCYRATIEEIDDPERRMRVRVRVIGVHHESTPVESLPWAESGSSPASLMSGDYFPYDIHDRVWVMFEGGDTRYPVYFGGWISEGSGVPETPAELVKDFSDSGQSYKWARVDKYGNGFILDRKPETARAYMISGSCSVTASQAKNTITIKSVLGNVVTEASNVLTTTRNYTISSNSTVFLGDGKNALGAPSAVFSVVSNSQANIHADDEVIIGGVVPKVAGVPVCSPVTGNGTTAGMSQRQSASTILAARTINIGVDSVTSTYPARSSLTPVFLKETVATNVRGVSVSVLAQSATRTVGAGTAKLTVGYGAAGVATHRIEFTAAGIVITSTSTVQINANVAVAGTITATGEITSGIIPLTTHKHIGVTTGGGTSGTPTP